MNALLGRSRALVTDVPGTTRDFLEETLDFAGLPVRLVDTAGLRESDDPVESLGIQRSREQLEDADLVLLVVDGAVQADPEAYLQGEFARGILKAAGEKPIILVWNKMDLASPKAFPPASFAKERDQAGVAKRGALQVSATDGDHLEQLVLEARRLLEQDLPAIEDGVAPNLRQAEAMAQAVSELTSLIADIDAGLPYDVLSVRLDFACACLRDIVGLGTSQDVLNRVFARFCIGK
jgi:tRNA modification GTPase